MAETCSMSVTCIVGLEGVSTYRSLVSGRNAFSTWVKSDVSTYDDWTPKREKSFSISPRLGPYTDAVLTMCAPASSRARYTVQMAPIPVSYTHLTLPTTRIV